MIEINAIQSKTCNSDCIFFALKVNKKWLKPT